MNTQPPSILSALHRLKSIALEGLRFSQNPYDIDRYTRLLEVTASGYAELLAVESAQMLEQLRSQIGVVTPKLGADAAVPDELGQILLLNRSDGRGWCLPCGWVDVHESPVQAAVREVWEETGLRVEPAVYAGISCKGPGKEAGLYHQVNVLTLMKPVPAGVAVSLSHEHTDHCWISAPPQGMRLEPGHHEQIRKVFAFLAGGAEGLAAE